MSFFEAIILGIVQGLTEFLPISSSGHLMLGEVFFGFEEPNIFFNVVLHIGTLVAVTLFYRKDIFGAVAGIWEATRRGLSQRSIEAFRETEGARLGVLLVLGSIPTALIGLILHPYVSIGGGQDVDLVMIISVMLIINGFILMSAKFPDPAKVGKRKGRWTLWNITPMVAIFIGVAQGLAVLPGFSRSGLTIVCALWLAVDRAESARFSFLLSIPAVGGAMLLETVRGADAQDFFAVSGWGEIGTYALASILAGVLGYLSILVLVKMLKKAQFWHFAWYCWAVGIGGLAWLWWM